MYTNMYMYTLCCNNVHVHVHIVSTMTHAHIHVLVHRLFSFPTLLSDSTLNLPLFLKTNATLLLVLCTHTVNMRPYRGMGFGTKMYMCTCTFYMYVSRVEILHCFNNGFCGVRVCYTCSVKMSETTVFINQMLPLNRYCN